MTRICHLWPGFHTCHFFVILAQFYSPKTWGLRWESIESVLACSWQTKTSSLQIPPPLSVTLLCQGVVWRSHICRLKKMLQKFGLISMDIYTCKKAKQFATSEAHCHKLAPSINPVWWKRRKLVLSATFLYCLWLYLYRENMFQLGISTSIPKWHTGKHNHKSKKEQNKTK